MQEVCVKEGWERGVHEMGVIKRDQNGAPEKRSEREVQG
jgi:hypothetical protein